MFDRSDLALLLAGVIGGVVFFLGLPSLWPLVDMELAADRGELIEAAKAGLADQGFDLDGYQASVRVAISRGTVDYIDKELGRQEVQRRIAEGSRLARYRVQLKKRGEPTTYTVELTDAGRLLGWQRSRDDGGPGAKLSEAEARLHAQAAALRGLGVDVGGPGYEERSVRTVDRGSRLDHEFNWSKKDSAGGLRESVTVHLSGDEVERASLNIGEGGAAKRAAKAAEAPARALEAVGFLLAAICGFAAFFVFLQQLQQGNVRLGRAAALSFAIFFGLLFVWLLDAPKLFEKWEPLWPRWLTLLDFVVDRIRRDGWQTLLLLAVIGAADALDRNSGANRGAALWTFLSGKWHRPEVGRASARGFLIGLVCGGVLTAVVVGLQLTLGARAELQPRSFFTTPLNSSLPALAAVVLFLNAALVEEIGYRFFGGTWFQGLTGRRWLAILVPALVFGLSHTRQEFLPPADPFWARAVAMTCVGLVWGWALFRYDALTLVLSHWVADLVFFSWPRIASARPEVSVTAALACLVPLIPAGLLLAQTLARTAGLRIFQRNPSQ